MKRRKPHHYCGTLILLLAVLSLFAWAYYPPATRSKSRYLTVRTMVLTTGRENATQPPPATPTKNTERDDATDDTR